MIQNLLMNFYMKSFIVAISIWEKSLQLLGCDAFNEISTSGKKLRQIFLQMLSKHRSVTNFYVYKM
jgi:hypothetical protein